jgi:hypothetical protein
MAHVIGIDDFVTLSAMDDPSGLQSWYGHLSSSAPGGAHSCAGHGVACEPDSR